MSSSSFSKSNSALDNILPPLSTPSEFPADVCCVVLCWLGPGQPEQKINNVQDMLKLAIGFVECIQDKRSKQQQNF